jgi:hypothetical protein
MVQSVGSETGDADTEGGCYRRDDDERSGYSPQTRQPSIVLRGDTARSGRFGHSRNGAADRIEAWLQKLAISIQ